MEEVYSSLSRREIMLGGLGLSLGTIGGCVPYIRPPVLSLQGSHLELSDGSIIEGKLLNYEDGAIGDKHQRRFSIVDDGNLLGFDVLIKSTKGPNTTKVTSMWVPLSPRNQRLVYNGARFNFRHILGEARVTLSNGDRIRYTDDEFKFEINSGDPVKYTLENRGEKERGILVLNDENINFGTSIFNIAAVDGYLLSSDTLSAKNYITRNRDFIPDDKPPVDDGKPTPDTTLRDNVTKWAYEN